MGKQLKKRERQNEPTSRKTNGTVTVTEDREVDQEVALLEEGEALASTTMRTDTDEQDNKSVVDVARGCHVARGETKILEKSNAIYDDVKRENDSFFITLHVFWGCTREHLIDLVVPTSISLIGLKEKIQSSEELIGHVAHTASLWWVYDAYTKKTTVLINKALEGAVTRLDDPTARQIGLRDGASLLIEGKPTHVALLAQSKIQALALDMRLMRDQLEVIGVARDEQRRQIAAFQQQMEQLRRRKEEHTRRLRDHFKAEAEEAKRMMWQQGGPIIGSEGGVGRHHYQQQQQQHPLAIILGAADRVVHHQAQTQPPSSKKNKKANSDLNNNNNTNNRRPLQQQQQHSLARLRQEESEILQLESALEREITLHRIREEAQQDVHFKHVARLESLTAQLVSMEEMAKRLSGMERMVREIAAPESLEEDEDNDGETEKRGDQEDNPQMEGRPPAEGCRTSATRAVKSIDLDSTANANNNNSGGREDGSEANSRSTATTTTTTTAKLSASRKRSDADLIDSMMLEFGQGVIKSVHSFKHRAGVGVGGGERKNEHALSTTTTTVNDDAFLEVAVESKERLERDGEKGISGSISSATEKATSNNNNDNSNNNNSSHHEQQTGKKRALREAEQLSSPLPTTSNRDLRLRDDDMMDVDSDAHHQKKGAGIASGLGIGRLIDPRAAALYERQQQSEKADRERALLEKRKAIIAAIALAKGKATTTNATGINNNTNTSTNDATSTPPPPAKSTHCTGTRTAADPSRKCNSHDESVTMTGAATRKESHHHHATPFSRLNLPQQLPPSPPAAFTFCAADTLMNEDAAADDHQQRQQHSQMDAEEQKTAEAARVSLLIDGDDRNFMISRLDSAAELEAYSKQPPPFGWQFVSEYNRKGVPFLSKDRSLHNNNNNNNNNNNKQHDVNETNNNNNNDKPCVVININAENDEEGDKDIDFGIKYPPPSTNTTTYCIMNPNASKEEQLLHLDVDVKTTPSLLNASLRSVIRGVRIFS